MAAIQSRPILPHIIPAQNTNNEGSTKPISVEALKVISTPTNLQSPLNFAQLSSFGLSQNHDPMSTIVLTGTSGIGAILIPSAATQGKNLVPILPKMSVPAQHSGKRRLLPLKKTQTRGHMSTVSTSQIPSRQPCTSSICTTIKTTASRTGVTTISGSNNRRWIGRPPRAVKKTSNEIRFILPKTSLLKTFSSDALSPSSSGGELMSKSQKSNILLDSNSDDKPNFNKNSSTSPLSRLPIRSEPSCSYLNNTIDDKHLNSDKVQTDDTFQTFASSAEVSAGKILPSAGASLEPNCSFNSLNSCLVRGEENLSVISSRGESASCQVVSCLTVRSEEKGYSSLEENGIKASMKSASTVEYVSEKSNSSGIPKKNYDEVVAKKKVIIIKSVIEEKTSSALSSRASSVLTILRNTDRSAFTLTKPTQAGTVASSGAIRTSGASLQTGVRSDLHPVPTSNIYERKVINETQSSFKIFNASPTKVYTSENSLELQGDVRASIQTPSINNLEHGFKSDSPKSFGKNVKRSYKHADNPNVDCDLSVCGIEVDEPLHDAIVNPANYQKFSKNTGPHCVLSPAHMITRTKTIVINSDDVSPEPDVNVCTTSKTVRGPNLALVTKRCVDKPFSACFESSCNATGIERGNCSFSRNSGKGNQLLSFPVDESGRITNGKGRSHPSCEDEFDGSFSSTLSVSDASACDKDRLLMTQCVVPTKAPSSSDQPPSSSEAGEHCYCLSRHVDAKIHSRQNKGATKVQTMLCQVCGKLLSGSSSLRTHLLTHSAMRPHACSVCQKRFKRRIYLQYHMLTHTDERPYVCTRCNAAFRTQQRLASHSLRHAPGKEGGRGYPCQLCSRIFETKHGLNSHSKQHAVKTPCSCEVCGKSFRSLTSLKLHDLAHKKPECLQHKCEVCGQMFVYRGLLKRHMETHSTAEPKYSCQVCSQKFLWKSSLVSHFKTHVPKKHECKLCPLSFHSEVKLNSHLKKHSNPKPHSCTLCLKKFAFRYLLNRHMRRRHGHRNFYRVKTKKALVDSAELNLAPDAPSPAAVEHRTELATLLPSRDESFSGVPERSSPSGALVPSLHEADFQVNDLSLKAKYVGQFNLGNPPKNNECIDDPAHENDAFVDNSIINFSLLRPDKMNGNNSSETEQIMNFGSDEMCTRPQNAACLPEELPPLDLAQMKQLSGHSLQPQNSSTDQLAKTKRHSNLRRPPPPAYGHSPHQLSLACPSQGELFANANELQDTKPSISSVTPGRTPDSSSRAVFCSPDEGGGLCCLPHSKLLPASTDPYLESSYSESPSYLSPADVAPHGANTPHHGADGAHHGADGTHHGADGAGAQLRVQCQGDAPLQDVRLSGDQRSTSVSQMSLYDNHSTPTSQYNYTHGSSSQYNYTHVHTSQYNQYNSLSHHLDLNHGNQNTSSNQYHHNTQDHHDDVDQDHGSFYTLHLPSALPASAFNTDYANPSEINPHLRTLNAPPPRLMGRLSLEGDVSETQRCSKISTQSTSTCGRPSFDGRGSTHVCYASSTPTNASPMFGVVGFASPLDYPSPSSAFLHTPSVGLTGDSPAGSSSMLTCLGDSNMGALEGLDA